MNDIKLPAGYEDWVARGGHQPSRPPYLRVTFERVNATGDGGEVVAVHWLMPPKPKPVLPDVKPGAVVRFTHKAYGTPVQAVKWRAGSDWHIQFKGAGNALCETYCGDAWMLATVDADGFTVELEGL